MVMIYIRNLILVMQIISLTFTGPCVIQKGNQRKVRQVIETSIANQKAN